MIKTVNGINIGIPDDKNQIGFYIQDGNIPDWEYISCHNKETLSMARQFLEGINENKTETE